MRTQRAAHRVGGFTLVEVMVALVIATLGLSAVITIASNSIDNAATFRQRALALYIGLNVITDMRLDNEFPDVREDTEEIEYANQDWLWTSRVIETDVDALRRVEVDVALAETPDDIVRTVTGFVGQPTQGDSGNFVWQGQAGQVR